VSVTYTHTSGVHVPKTVEMNYLGTWSWTSDVYWQLVLRLLLGLVNIFVNVIKFNSLLSLCSVGNYCGILLMLHIVIQLSYHQEQQKLVSSHSGFSHCHIFILAASNGFSQVANIW